MKILPLVALALSFTAWAQVPPAPLPPPANPDAVVATINKKPLTAGELWSLLNASPPQARQNYLNDPKSFLQQLGMVQELADMAEKAHLDQQSPTKEALAHLEMQYKLARMNGLAQAQYGALADSIPVTADDQKKYYEANHDKYTQAKVKELFVSFQSGASLLASPNARKSLTEPEAKAKIEKLLAELRAGRDFIKTLKENSDDAESVARDGDFGQPISASDKAIPAEISKAIFSLKPGNNQPGGKKPRFLFLPASRPPAL